MNQPQTITERIMRHTVDRISSELYVSRIVHYVAVSDIGAPVCRTHHPNTDDCRAAIAAVSARRLHDSLTIDEGN